MLNFLNSSRKQSSATLILFRRRLSTVLFIAFTIIIAIFHSERVEPPLSKENCHIGFDLHECKGLYFDLGSNIGVQIRKLYDPHLFPEAPVLPLFDEVFGQFPRNEICAIGFEPNVKHSIYLKALEEHLQCQGRRAKIYTETAVTVLDGKMIFYGDETASPENNEWGASLVKWQETSNASTYTVQGLNFGRFLKECIMPSITDAVPIIMKMDIEGAEFEVVAQMLKTGSFCHMHSVMIEWHPNLVPDPIQGTIQEEGLLSFINQTRTVCNTNIQHVDDETYGNTREMDPMTCNRNKTKKY